MKTSEEKKDSKIESVETSGSLPMINILWLGVPSTRKAMEAAGRSRGVIDHDILGIIEGLDKLKNPVTFWCPLADLKEYQDRLSKHPRVIIRAIEPYIEERLKSKDPFTRTHAKNFLQIKSELLSEKRICSRNILTVKVLLAFFILADADGYDKGNYVVDSYLKTIDKTDHLPAFSHFYVPWKNKLEEFSSYFRPHWKDATDEEKLDWLYRERYIPNKKPKIFDCWMMYSPASDRSVARKILEDFEKIFIGPDKAPEKTMDSEPFCAYKPNSYRC